MAAHSEATDIVLVPNTGEAIDLATAQTDELGRFLHEARDFESRAREAKARVTAEVLRRMDFDGLLTLRVGDYELNGDGPGHKVDWNVDMLHETLTTMVSEGLISRVAKEAALEQVRTYKVRQRGITALIKQGGQIAERISACGEAVDKQRRVRVEKKP